MLPVLEEMATLGLLTWEEAIEAQAYSSSNVQTWLSMPDALMRRVHQAYLLLSWNPEEMPGEPLH